VADLVCQRYFAGLRWSGPPRAIKIVGTIAAAPGARSRNCSHNNRHANSWRVNAAKSSTISDCGRSLPVLDLRTDIWLICEPEHQETIVLDLLVDFDALVTHSRGSAFTQSIWPSPIRRRSSLFVSFQKDSSARGATAPDPAPSAAAALRDPQAKRDRAR